MEEQAGASVSEADRPTLLMSARSRRAVTAGVLTGMFLAAHQRAVREHVRAVADYKLIETCRARHEREAAEVGVNAKGLVASAGRVNAELLSQYTCALFLTR